jgi:hypothetical protein
MAKKTGGLYVSQVIDKSTNALGSDRRTARSALSRLLSALSRNERSLDAVYTY